MQPELEAWVSECLLMRIEPSHIMALLQDMGVSNTEAEQTMALIEGQPMFKTASRLVQHMKRLEWQLYVYEQNYKAFESNQGFVDIDRSALDPDWFFTNHYSASRPMVVRNFLGESPALSRWTDTTYLRSHYGQIEVQVKTAPIMESLNLRDLTLPFGEYLDRIEDPEQTKDTIYYLTAYNAPANQTLIEAMMTEIVEPEGCFDPALRQEHSYLWVGPKQTKARFHIDMQNAFLSQVVGVKHVRLVPPHHMHYMYMMDNHFSSEVDTDNFNPYQHQLFNYTQPVDVVLNPSDAVFFPATWWHYVESQSFSISVTMSHFKWPNEYLWFHQRYPQFDKI